MTDYSRIKNLPDKSHQNGRIKKVMFKKTYFQQQKKYYIGIFNVHGTEYIILLCSYVIPMHICLALNTIVKYTACPNKTLSIQ